MNKIITSVGIVGTVAAVGLLAAAPAVAQPFGWGWNNHNYHRSHHVYRGGYYPGYYGYGYGYDPGAAIATGIIGGIVGTIAHEAIRGGGGSSHVARCEANFRSYQRSTNTYMGYDGVRHVCNL